VLRLEPDQGAARRQRFNDVTTNGEKDMQPRITFRGMDPSPAVEAAVNERIARLARFHDRITSCAVTIEAPHRSGRKGKIYSVHVDLVVPGHEIVAGRDREQNHAHEDVYVAVRDAFDTAQRQLTGLMDRISGRP